MRLVVPLALLLVLASVSSFSHAQTMQDDPAFTLYREAGQAMMAKDYQRATQLAKEAIALYPDHLLAWDLLGQAAMGRSAWAEAVEAFTNVIKRYPGSFSGHRDLGLALAHLGRMDQARTEFQAALALRPDNDDMRMRLAFMLFNQDQRDLAMPMLEDLAKANSQEPEVYLLLGRAYYDRGDLTASEKAFTKATALRDDGKIWFNLGIVRMRLHDFSGAQVAFKRAAQDPELRPQANRELDRIRETLRLGTR